MNRGYCAFHLCAFHLCDVITGSSISPIGDIGAMNYYMVLDDNISIRDIVEENSLVTVLNFKDIKSDPFMDTYKTFNWM